MGFLLLQQDVYSYTWKPILFTSKQLKNAEFKYPVHENEFLAAINALRKWRRYFHGENFDIITNHLSLKWLINLKEPRDRLARWVLDMQDFDFTIHHANGPNLVVPDTHSMDAVSKPLYQRCYRPIIDEL